VTHGLRTTGALTERDADPAKAFDTALGMESDFSGIENLVDALYLIAASEHDERTSGALYAIANGIEDHLEEAEEKRKEIFHITWAYRCGSRREPIKAA
jgi:hypothetical protein